VHQAYAVCLATGIRFSDILWRMADQREHEVRKGAHCAWQIHYHIVFPVKYRKALLDEEVTAIIQETAAEIAARFPIEMEAIGTDKNHIHLLCSAPRKWLRGGLCRCSRASQLGKSFDGNLPSNEYYVATVGERANWQAVERYVQRQGQPREDLRQLRMF